MTNSDWIAIAGASISFVSMVTAIFFANKAASSSRKANQNALDANAIAIGQSETSMRAEIQNSRSRSEESVNRISDFLQGRKTNALEEHEKIHLEQLESSWRSAIEGYLNSYEDACGKYLDHKTDKTRFRKSYINEIKNICDPKRDSYSRLMHPDSTSNFQAIWKVYKEWHQHE